MTTAVQLLVAYQLSPLLSTGSSGTIVDCLRWVRTIPSLGETLKNILARKDCTNHTAEVKVLEQGSRAVSDLPIEDVVYLSDSKSLLDAINSPREDILVWYTI